MGSDAGQRGSAGPVTDVIPDTDADADVALVATVDRLRDEVDGLRQAMRSRAVIEQAKGMMMERHGISTDQAFERLATLSQHANVKLVDVAAALVDTPAPAVGRPGSAPEGSAAAATSVGAAPTPAEVARIARERLDRRWPTQGSGAGEFGRRIRAQGRAARVRAELITARAPGEVLNTVIGTACADRPPDAAVLAVLDVNGVLHTIAAHGVPSAAAARWRDLPVDLPLIGCQVARTGEPQWLDGDPVDGASVGFGLSGPFATVVVLPFALERSRGVLALTWTSSRLLDDPAKADLERLAGAVAVAVGRLPESPGPNAGRVQDISADPTIALLDVLYDPVILGEPVTDADGSVVDLRLLHANPAAVDSHGRTLADQPGRSLVELLPDLVRAGMLDACGRVWRTGAQAELAGDRPGAAGLRVTRYRDGLLITWSLPRVQSHPEEGR